MPGVRFLVMHQHRVCQLSVFVAGTQLLSSASLPISLSLFFPAVLHSALDTATSSPLPTQLLISGHSFRPAAGL